MYVSKNEVSVRGVASNSEVRFTADELTDDQLAAIATGRLKLSLAKPKTIEGVK